MTTKEKVLGLLEANRGISVSGASIAAQLGVSRNAVWKAIRELCKAGHQIEAASNRGYRLGDGSDVLSVQGISLHLSDKSRGVPIRVYDCVESTNIIAKEAAVAGAQHGTTVTAERQSAGKGRYERPFSSPPGGIYLSMVFHTDALPLFQTTPTFVTALAAVAVCEAIESLIGKSPRIKWVNDIFLESRAGAEFKVCGISAEAVTDFVSGATQWVVLGIGVNFNTAPAAFPEELRGVAGSLFAEDEPPPITRNRLIAEIVNRLLGCEHCEKSLLAAYKSRLMLGRRVVVSSPRSSNLSYTATALDIDEVGRLIVRKDCGEEAVLCSGEIRIVFDN
jgi:BirA family biotin operon repressor/biotin-[acetyl-CoA-carboxylase] ligase